MLTTLYKKKLDDLLVICKKNLTSCDVNLITDAFKFSLNAHRQDKRASGEPFITHPYEVSKIIVREIPLDDISVASGLLHDVVEDTPFTYQDIVAEFGETIANIVDGATKIEGMFENYETRQVENYKKMLLSMSNDIRVILVKFADRLHNMRTLEFLATEKQVRMSKETMEIYAPLAHKLGLSRVKIELEDLSFKFLDRTFYNELAKKVKEKRKERENYINKFIEPVKKVLKKENFKFEIFGRAKHLYSIAKKMKNRGKGFEEIYDLFAVRIILDTDDNNACYQIYGHLTEIYLPNQERFKDYISLPKSNGYKSIHTTLVGPDGKLVEVQIRTRSMNEIAEKGVAAHWKYKENDQIDDSKFDDWVSWLRDLFDTAAKENTPRQMMENLKLNLYQDEIFVFTPKGELIRIPKNSTPVDFAFAIHTQVGYKCIGAKVNGRIAPLDSKLKSGDQIEIITSKKEKPNQDWEKFVITHKAKSEIHKWLNFEKRKKIEEGKEFWEKKLKKHKLSLSEDELIKLMPRLTFENVQHLYESISVNNTLADEVYEIIKDKNKLLSGEIVSRFVRPLEKAQSAREYHSQLFESYIKSARSAKSKIIVGGESGDLLFTYANCCNPIPGEEIIGFVTKTEGVKVHKKSCKNLTNLFLIDPDRIIDVQWPGIDTMDEDFFVGIRISGEDSPGMLNKITSTISSHENTNIKSVNIVSKGSTFDGTVILMVRNINHLNQLIEKIKNIDAVFEVRRFEE